MTTIRCSADTPLSEEEVRSPLTDFSAPPGGVPEPGPGPAPGAPPRAGQQDATAATAVEPPAQWVAVAPETT